MKREGKKRESKHFAFRMCKKNTKTKWEDIKEAVMLFACNKENWIDQKK